LVRGRVRGELAGAHDAMSGRQDRARIDQRAGAIAAEARQVERHDVAHRVAAVPAVLDPARTRRVAVVEDGGPSRPGPGGAENEGHAERCGTTGSESAQPEPPARAAVRIFLETFQAAPEIAHLG